MAVGDMVTSALGAAQRAQLDRARQGGSSRPLGIVRLGSMANPIKQVPQASPVAQAVAAPQSAVGQSMTTGQEVFAPGGMFGSALAQADSAQGVVPMDTSAMDAWNRANTQAQMGGPANTAPAPVQAQSTAQQFAQRPQQDMRAMILQAFQKMSGMGMGGQMGGSLGRGNAFPTGPAMRPANSGGFGQFNPQMLTMLQNRGNIGNSLGSGRQWPF